MKHLEFYHNLLIGLHIIVVIAWMAGLLYLPRLFAYHHRATPGGETRPGQRLLDQRRQPNDEARLRP